MSKPLDWWRVDFVKGGKPIAIRCTGPDARSEFVVYVQAATMEAAVRAAHNAYDRERVARRRQEYKAAGRCPCGRERTCSFLRCDVCRARENAHKQRAKERQRQGVVEHVRDDVSRLASHKETQRNRREELRLETLLLIRRKWAEFSTTRLFSLWLAEEIERALAGTPSAETPADQIEQDILNIATAIRERRLAREQAERASRPKKAAS